MEDTSISSAEIREKCCINCRYFDSRPGFCRYNPPVPIVTQTKTGPYITSAYSKINLPNLDWCQKFEKIS